MSQTTLDTPKQNNYEMILEQLKELEWIKMELKDLRLDIFDLSSMIGRQATMIQKWVGVAEEND